MVRLGKRSGLILVGSTTVQVCSFGPRFTPGYWKIHLAKTGTAGCTGLPSGTSCANSGPFAMNDPNSQPIFVHCLVGDDRTTFVVGLYRVYFENWTPQEAWNEMLRRGYHARWWLSGLESYFWRHTRKPSWVGGANATSARTDWSRKAPQTWPGSKPGRIN